MKAIDVLSHRGVSYGIRADGSVLVLMGAAVVEVTEQTNLDELCSEWKLARKAWQQHYDSLEKTARLSAARLKHLTA